MGYYPKCQQRVVADAASRAGAPQALHAASAISQVWYCLYRSFYWGFKQQLIFLFGNNNNNNNSYIYCSDVLSIHLYVHMDPIISI
jgi:hypothetical protein